jgi:uncharacterized protein (TIGR02001 family)
MNIKSKLLLALLATSSAAFAQTAPAAPESTLGYNVGVVSEYRYRGIGQTKGDPALQGGVDYAHSSGAYVGTWASNISWIKDTSTTGATGKTEVDIYGGYKFEAAGLGLDVGFLRYEYVKNDYQPNASTNEVYGAATYGVTTLKYSQSISNLFGNADSKGSTYLELGATFDLGNGYSLVPHAGRQVIKNWADLSYTDYALTLNKDFGDGLVGSVTAISIVGGSGIAALSNTKYDASKDVLVVGVKYSF